jgi:branched-chain amino acid aminotransferase
MPKSFPFAFINNKFCKAQDAKIPIQCKAVQYGLGCFSGIRGYFLPKEKNIFLFRLKDHYTRLKEATNILGMKFPYSFSKFETLVKDLVKKNKAKEDIYIRPTVYASAPTLTPRFDNPDDDLALYMIPLKDYFTTDTGLKTCVSSWRRFSDDSISVKAKVTGSYASSALAKTEAIANGFDEAIFLNHEGKVCEASSSNIFGVKDNIFYTPPLSASILDGISRRSIIELVRKEMQMELKEENIDRSTLYSFDELFLTGTAVKISWIKSVDKRIIGDGKMGKNSEKLMKLFNLVVQRKLIGYEKWLTKVY